MSMRLQLPFENGLRHLVLSYVEFVADRHYASYDSKSASRARKNIR